MFAMVLISACCTAAICRLVSTVDTCECLQLHRKAMPHWRTRSGCRFWLALFKNSKRGLHPMRSLPWRKRPQQSA